MERRFPWKNNNINRESREYRDYQSLSQAFSGFSNVDQTAPYNPPLNLVREEPFTGPELSALTQDQIRQLSLSLKNDRAAETVRMLLGKISKELMPFIAINRLKELSFEALLLIPEESLKSLKDDDRLSLIKAGYEKVPFKEGQKDLDSVEWSQYENLRKILN